MDKSGYFSFVEEISQECFYPLTHLRKVENLVCGAYSLVERIHKQAPGLKYYGNQDSMFEMPLILFSNAYILSSYLVQEVVGSLKDNIWVSSQGQFLACKISSSLKKYEINRCASEDILQSSLSKIQVENRHIVHCLKDIANLLEVQSAILHQDLEAMLEPVCPLESPYYVQGSPSSLFVSESASIAPFVVFNTLNGGIFIEEGVMIQAFSYIEGPCIIKKDAQIIQGRIRSSYIGEGCKVGGEVSTSVFLSFSNKAHDGYVGDSYIGSFVNFGALATTSNLKNNYSPISLQYLGKTIKTQSLKLGSIIGDFTVLGIGVLLNTGTSIGICCNITQQKITLPKDIVSFSWYGTDGLKKYNWDKLLKSICIRMERRNKTITTLELEQIQRIYQES